MDRAYPPGPPPPWTVQWMGQLSSTFSQLITRQAQVVLHLPMLDTFNSPHSLDPATSGLQLGQEALHNKNLDDHFEAQCVIVLPCELVTPIPCRPANMTT